MMTHSQPVRNDSKRKGILQNAFRLFSQYGYRRTSIDEIAAEAQVAKGTLYAHFDGKETLFRALCAWMGEQIEADAQQAANNGPFSERITCVLLAKFPSRYRELYRSPHASEFFSTTSSIAADLTADFWERYRLIVERTIAEGLVRGEIAANDKLGDAASIAAAFLAAAHGAASVCNGDPEAQARMVESLSTVLAQGLAPF